MSNIWLGERKQICLYNFVYPVIVRSQDFKSYCVLRLIYNN